MHVILSEEEQAHLYSCLLVGNGEFAKIKKSLAKLNREDEKVDDEINLNAALRRQFNPRAEQEAREEAERKRASREQLDITDQMASSGETGGGNKAGQTVKLSLVGEEDIPPTDEALRDSLLLSGHLVLLADIRRWTSSEREQVVKFLTDVTLWVPGAETDVPGCVDAVAITQERCDELTRVGPYTTKSLPEGADDSTSVLIILPPETPDDSEMIEGEYLDGVEAEIQCARLNRDLLRQGDMDDALVTRWLIAGPWEVTSIEDKWYAITNDSQDRERADSEVHARAIAARYNRTLAGRENDGSWKEPPPPRLSEDAAQEIDAAVEASVDG